MKYSIIILLVLFASKNSYAQLPSKSKKLVGTWAYKEGSGFETWELNNEELVGSAYRINNKTKDTSKVEEMHVRRPNKKLLYITETYNIMSDSLITRKQNFVADGRKMKFFNLENQTPHSIEYKFGFFSKNKLKVKIHYGPYDKPITLILFRHPPFF